MLLERKERDKILSRQTFRVGERKREGESIRRDRSCISRSRVSASPSGPHHAVSTIKRRTSSDLKFLNQASAQLCASVEISEDKVSHNKDLSWDCTMSATEDASTLKRGCSGSGVSLGEFSRRVVVIDSKENVF